MFYNLKHFPPSIQNLFRQTLETLYPLLCQREGFLSRPVFLHRRTLGNRGEYERGVKIVYNSRFKST